jgi:hypothetical protein
MVVPVDEHQFVEDHEFADPEDTKGSDIDDRQESGGQGMG